MAVRFGPYEVLLVVAAIATAVVAVYAWRRRDKPGATFLALILAGNSCWAVLSLVGSLASGEPLALLSAKLVYLFVPITVTGVFLFALTYTGREDWLGPRLYAALAVEPLLLNVAVWTNDLHGAFWTIDGVSNSSRIGWDITFEILFHVHIGYSYLLMAAATVWLVQFALGADRLYQRQIFGLLGSLAPPWVANVLFIFAPLPADPTPIALALTGLGLTWSILRARLLDIAPIARAAVIETIADGVIVVDDTRRVVDANAAARELFDWPDQAVGTRLESALGDAPEATARIEPLLQDYEEGSTELKIADRYFTVDVAPLEDVRGEFIGHALLVHDVTERKDRELELERRNEQLDRFAGVVSHDLRNPLHVASSALELANETGKAEHFERVERAHSRMEQLIDDLLMLAREGAQIADREPVSLATIARTSWDTVSTDSATLEIDGDTTLLADPNRLQQLLENLYRNSVEHGSTSSRTGPDDSVERADPSVTVRVAPTEDGFLVEDDGPGIPAAVRERVLEGEYTTEDTDVGIGLMVVSHVAEAHGWEMTIDQPEGGGARFRFSDVGASDTERSADKPAE